MKKEVLPFVERLLNGEKVEWKKVGDCSIVEIVNGARKAVKSSERTQGNIPYYGANNVQDYVEGYTHEGEYILVAEDGSASLDNYSIQWAKGKFWANNHVHVLRGINQLDSRFLYFYLQVVNFLPYLSSKERAKLTKAKLELIPIPLPPLHVQHKLVEILDKFTTLEAELETKLEAEQEARNKQYEYCREKLLTFNNIKGGKIDISWVRLGDVAQYSQMRIKATHLHSDNYVGVDNLLANREGKVVSTYIPDEGTFTTYNRGDVLIGNIRPYLKKIWQADNAGGASGDVLVVCTTTEGINKRYLYHVLADDRFFIHTMRYAKGAKMPRGNKDKIMEYNFPLPPLSEQERIVSILDRFETLTHSITEGLPHEIALRRKQYEYYRERLLTFPTND